MHSFIDPELLDNNVPFDNTTILAFFTENKENQHLFFREFHGR